MKTINRENTGVLLIWNEIQAARKHTKNAIERWTKVGIVLKNNRDLSIIVLKKQPGFKYLSKNGFNYEHIGILKKNTLNCWTFHQNTIRGTAKAASLASLLILGAP